MNDLICFMTQSYSFLKKSKLTVFFLGIVVFLFWTNPVQAAEVPELKPMSTNKLKPRMTTCIDKNLGYRIKCSPDWKLETKPKSISLLINEQADQTVSMTVTQHEENGLTLADLTPKALKDVFRYAEHFRIGKTNIGKEKGVVVEAALADFPDVMVLDYYLIKDQFLYRISFSVNKRELYSEYKPLFRKLITSFVFFDPNEPLKTAVRPKG